MIIAAVTAIIKGLDPQSISIERKTVLQPLIYLLQQELEKDKQVNLNFICTHNSRRSHLAQVWAQTMASFFNLNKVSCYSGGTEATALFPVVATTLSRQGFQLHTIAGGHNPVYAIKYDHDAHPMIGFSKKFDDAFNPQSHFVAIMTCSQADKGCPFIPGATKRIAITYDDPKAFDNTPMQEEKYMERSAQIATEMYYIFSQINLR